MKILFTSQDYYPYLSGVPIVVKYLAEGLVLRGHDVSVATCLHENNTEKEVVNGVNVFRFNIRLNLLKHGCGRTTEYIDFILNFGADVVIIECTQCITTDLLLPYISTLKSKIIFQAHGFSGLDIKGAFAICDGFLHTIGHTYNWIRSQYYFKYWLKKYIQYVDVSLVLSEMDNGKPFLDHYLGNNNYILGNAADDMFFMDYSKEKNPLWDIIGLKASRYCFSCAYYSVVKNQKDMIREFYKIHTKDCALVCIGGEDTKYYYECLDLVKKLNEEYEFREVHLLHHIERKLLPLIENKATLYLASSSTEQYSISIIEAMSQGIPFISTNKGNARMLPGGVTINNIGDMHIEIDRLLNDDYKYERYAKAGKKYAYENCRIDVAVDRLNRIIIETCTTKL